ncbi:nucleotidyltransferase [Archaeoglobales archaeon]|nr:MAG: nucleotidyltransferase [Archaeoglobales archaeon]
MTRKTATFGTRKEVVYDEDRWKNLKDKRKRAKKVMSSLKSFDLKSIVYGSVARGDVTKNSDVDVFVPYKVPSYRIELALDKFQIIEKRIVQATPNYAIKGEFLLEDNTTVSFPLVKMKERELDFYRFGGALDYDLLLNGERVAGVDKRLILIIPTENGHREIPINEIQPSAVAKILNVGIEIINERMRVLLRRREVGRTGVFLCETISYDESFESALNCIAAKNPAVRRIIKNG